MSRSRPVDSYPDCPECKVSLFVVGSKRAADYECLMCERLFDVGGGR